jgi:RHS repeat-associated protein
LETPTAQSWYNGNSNQISTWGYDAAGNITHVGSMTRNFTYDVENRQASATIGGATSMYTYDAEGRRVTKTGGSQTTVYVYDAFGHLTAEYGSTPISGTLYLTSDTLGSTRLTTTGNSTSGASLGQNFDYRPFGEEIGASWAGRDATFSPDSYPSAPSDPSMRFTGKERDAETGLDFFGARYMSGAEGRFTGPDGPLYDQEENDPQSWNLYTYARNNPLASVDPTGMFVVSPPDPWAPGGALFDLWWNSFLRVVQVVQRTQQTSQQVVDWASQPRDPGCVAAATGIGAADP